MLPLHKDYLRVDGEDLEPEASRVHTAPSVPLLAAPPLLHSVAWGALAEGLTSVCCPIVVLGDLDVSATMLNVSGAFLAGIAHSVASAATSQRLCASCSAFQAGFIGVFTSFTFVAEQAARLAAAPDSTHGFTLRAAGYVGAVLAAQLAAFGAACALAGRCGLPRMPAVATQTRALFNYVALICVWVALSPTGAVSDPLQLDAPHLAVPTKLGDALQLGTGLLLQAAGLWLSLRLAKPAALSAQTLILWAPLRCNLVATALLLMLRATPCDGVRRDEGAQCPFVATALVAKLCSSGCGAISVSGGLSPALWALWAGGGRRGKFKAALNLAIHGVLACLVCWFLPLRRRRPLQPQLSEPPSFAPPLRLSPPMMEGLTTATAGIAQRRAV